MSKKYKNKNIALIILIIITLVLIIILLFKLKPNKNKIIGTWTTDGVTIYEFKKHNKGILTLPLSSYKFTYKIDDDKLFIDFENENSADSQYNYSIDNGKLTLKGDKGTFIFTKK